MRTFIQLDNTKAHGKADRGDVHVFCGPNALTRAQALYPRRKCHIVGFENDEGRLEWGVRD